MQPQLVIRGLGALWRMGAIEQVEGTLGATLARMGARRGLAFARDWTFAELLEWAARKHRFRPFLEYGDERISFNDMNRRANRVARRLRAAGVGEGTGVALMLSNHPRFLDTFFALQKLGAYAVPINTAQVGEGLRYLLTHSEVDAIVCDHEAAAKVARVRKDVPRLTHAWVSRTEAPDDFVLPDGMSSFAELERGSVADGQDLGYQPSADSPSLLLYTSGTSGPAKAVVSPYGQSRTKSLGVLAHLLYNEGDKLYTCLPLFHANALLLTVMPALWVGTPLWLAKRFRASAFWQELASCGATQLNTVGSMIPVLLKTPPSPHDRSHRVRRIISAACPKDAWEPFEKRFGVRLWEAYGAVDGGGVTIVNSGNAPKGSLGRPGRLVNWRLVDGRGHDVERGQIGELWVKVSQESTVRYWKDDKASADKVVDGWLRTGDLMTADARGHLYFVGRNTDSVRRRGENVSAYEVEKVVLAHPDVLECAAFGVPSPVGEQDIMLCVVAVDRRQIQPEALARFLRERLPRYAVPSYLEILSELPKTGTHRVIKSELKQRGLTPTTIPLDALGAG